ncbi:MAG: AmmeMemoRadiSam system protein A [Peptococcaceae bacterium]|nr:AmmeMemoRadiSam system protein A [Peptococcaceae bacterium]
MGRIVMGALTPHPPIIIAEVGGNERDKAGRTIDGMRQLTQDLLAAKPKTLVIISPHGPVFQDAIFILGWEKLSGNFAKFAASDVKLEFTNDLKLAQAIEQAARARGIVALVGKKDDAKRYGIDLALDHGVMVPLDFLRRSGFAGEIVVMGMAMFANDELYEFGRAIQDAIAVGTDDVAVIASGDLSHRLTPDAPAGYNARGSEFDQTILAHLQNNDFAGIMNMEQDLQAAAGECGYRPLNILLGVFDGYQVKTNVYSYEGPFGVGYMVAGLMPQGVAEEQQDLVGNFRQIRLSRIEEARLHQHPTVRLAVQSLEHFLRTGDYLTDYAALPDELPQRAGVFVSIKQQGQLRGCIGTIAPTQANLAQEIIHNAVRAGTQDPRFDPLTLPLGELSFSVDILGQVEQIKSEAELDPQQYGVIVHRNGRSGLLLPNLEGIDSALEQVAIAKKKAGIGPHEAVELSRFVVKRFT